LQKIKNKPYLEEILSAIQTFCRNYITVYIVVDALDECTNTNSTREKLINELRQLQAAATVDLRLMFTSRFIPNITQKFGSNLVLEVRASEEDVSRYVAGQIPRLSKCIQHDEELKHTVHAKIIEAADGI
jgi:heterodisulfide reductase subunit B